VSSAVERLLSRAREELAAAQVLADSGFRAQAISRAYFSAFYAAEAALSSIGETRSKHAGVIAAFGKLFVRERRFPEAEGRVLRSLFERRNEADYAHVAVPSEEVAEAIADATRFVAAVTSWLET
jgi:uncharacterized protein (UPF0332 family)